MNPLFDTSILDVMNEAFDAKKENNEMLVLWALACHCPDFLSSKTCPYIFILGPKAKGKSRITEYVARIAGGTFLGLMSPKLLPHKIDKEGQKPVGFDQLEDLLRDEDIDIEHMLEVTDFYGATYPVSKGTGFHDYKCGCPKIINGQIPPRPALRTRCYEFRAFSSARSGGIDIKWDTDVDDDITMVRTELQSCRENILKARPNARSDVQAYMKSPEYKAKVDVLTPFQSRRTKLLGVFEPMRWLARWDDVDVVKALSYSFHDDDEDSKKCILAESFSLGWHSLTEMCDILNQAEHTWRRCFGQVSPRELGAILRDANVEEKRYTGGMKFFFDSSAITKLTEM